MNHPEFTEAEIITRLELRRMAAAGWRVTHSLSVSDGEILTMRNGQDCKLCHLPAPTVYASPKREGLSEIGNALACLARLSNTILPGPVRAMMELGARHLEIAQVTLARTPDEPDPIPTARQTSFRKGGA